MRYLNDEIIPDQLRYCNVLYEHMPIVLSATHNLNNIEYSQGNMQQKRHGQKYERFDNELAEEAGFAAYEVCACVDK